MTEVITRYFEDAAQARSAKYELIHRQRVSAGIVRLFDDAEGLADRLVEDDVRPKTARAYEKRLASGGAVLLVRAGYKPLGVARITRDVTSEQGASDLGDLEEDVYVKEAPRPRLSILSDHPHMLLRARDPDKTNYHMADWPIPLISRRRPYTGSLLSPHARMAAFPLPLTFRRKPFTGSIFAPHARMADFPIPLINRRKPYTKSIFPRHARMADFPIPLISRRKPYTGTKIGRHTRMANWPFPLLINGKTQTNSLIPGGPRMANFPIPLLSDREPYTGSAIPRHARMANFPIPLISRREPYTKSAFPRHARMADFLLPLVVRRSGTSERDAGFSFSRMLRLPTIIRRENAR